jgi:predicted lipid carrier protein YhbT
MTPAMFAAIVARLSDKQLAAGLAVSRELILNELFRQFPENLDSAAAGDLRAVVHWRIEGRSDGGHDQWEVSIADGRAAVEREGAGEPDVAYTIDALDFLKLVAGRHEGPELFMSGKLVVEGDLVLAAQMPRLFVRPGHAP